MKLFENIKTSRYISNIKRCLTTFRKLRPVRILWKGARADFPFLSFPPGIPKGIDYGVVGDVFRSVEGIVAVHDLRIWGLTTDKTALSAHLAISKCIITITFCS